jgi:hypothetical protein
MSEVHQRCVGDRLGTTRIGDGHEMFEQGIMFRVVPTNVHNQTPAEVSGDETGRTSPQTPRCSRRRTCESRSGDG